MSARESARETTRDDDDRSPHGARGRGERLPPVVTTPWGTGGRALAIVVGAILVVAALKLAKPLLLPLALGLFLAVLGRPMHLGLRARLPRGLRWLGLVATMLAMLVVVVAFGAALGWSGRAVAEELRTRRPEIERRVAPLRGAASRVGIDLPLPGPADASARGEGGGGESAPSSGDSAAAGGGTTGDRVLRTLLSTLAGLLLALAFAALGLAEADEARRRLAHIAGGRRALEIVDEAAPAFRRYVWVKSLTSAITGAATALAALAFGLPLAWVWGFIAFLLEYVPSVGSVLAVVPPTLMAVADGGIGRAAAVFLTIGALQVILGNVIDPKLEGRLMAVSPFGVLFSIVFWGWVWGPVGALLAVPLTVAVVIACRHLPGAQGVATLVAGDGIREAGASGARAARAPEARDAPR